MSSCLNLVQMLDNSGDVRVFFPFPSHVLLRSPWDDPVNYPILIVDHVEQNVLHAVEAGFPVLCDDFRWQLGEFVSEVSPHPRHIGIQFLYAEHATSTGLATSSSAI